MQASLTRRVPAFAVTTLLATALAGCGAAAVHEGGGTVQTAAFVSGAQSATGSLAVAGASLSTSGATVSWPDDGRTITVDPNAPSGLSFRKGTIVGARATLADATNGVATQVLVRCAVRGPVQSHTGSSLVVAGVDVRLDRETAVLDASDGAIALSAVPDGARVEVHGWAESGTRVRASLVRLLPGAPAVVVRGWTTAAPVNGSFELSLQQGGAAVLRVEQLAPIAGLPANALVRVEGDVLTQGTIPTLQATGVAVEAQFLPNGGDSAVIEGIVTARTPQALIVGEFPVRIGANAWSGLATGESPDAVVQPGAHVVVRGKVASGAVTADSIAVVNHWYADARIAPGSFAVGNPATYGVFTLSGASVVVDTSTALTGAGGAPLTIAELAGLQAGAPTGLAVRVRGYTRADGDVQALAIEVTGS